MRTTGQLLAVGLLLASFTVEGAEAQTVPLYSWYSPSRGDNFATTDPRWAGRAGDTRSPDYRFVRIEGQLLSEARPGTRPLYSWYSPSRGDNFLTSDPRWVGRPGEERDGYRFVRLEGYVYEEPVAGTYPLQSFWDRERADNFATSSPLWIGQVGDTRPPAYRLYRTEGHLVASPSEPPPELLLQRVGYSAAPVRGQRPLLIVQTDFPDLSPVNTLAYFDSLFFGPRDPSVTGLYRTVSGGVFGFRRAGVIRVRFDDLFAVATANVGSFDRKVIQLAAEAGVDFASFDANRDGLTTLQELAIVVVNPVDAGGGCGGQTRGVVTAWPGLRYSGQVSFTHENGDLNLYTHELFHQLAGSEHIYGPGASVNARASLFAANFCAATTPGPFHLDPWFKIRLGWLRPRIHPILDSGWSTYLEASDPAPGAGGEPIVLYDPARGPDELFILEYRTPTGPRSEGYDAGVVGQGLAVWYVKKDRGHRLLSFNWPPPIARPYAASVGNHMLTDFIIGKSGTWGAGPFWTATDGEFALRWGDGADSGLRVKVGALAPESGVLAVQWRKDGRPFLPRIDVVRPAAYPANTPTVLTIDGMFPVDGGGLSVTLNGAGGARAATVRTVATERLTATAPATSAGEYSVVVGLGSGLGNAHPIRVTSAGDQR